METASQIEPWHNPSVMESSVRPGYSDRLFYHVYEHALDTRSVARELGKWCAYNGEEVDFYILDWAALGHDFGFLEYKDLAQEEKDIYPSREKYAAAMTAEIMADMGAPQDMIQRVKETIWSTEAGVECISLEGKIIRQADLANVGSENHVTFFRNTLKLYREWRMLNGNSPYPVNPREFISYCVKSAQVLTIYNEEDVSFGDFDRKIDGKSEFCILSDHNIHLLFPNRIKYLARMAGSNLLQEIDIA